MQAVCVELDKVELCWRVDELRIGFEVRVQTGKEKIGDGLGLDWLDCGGLRKIGAV